MMDPLRFILASLRHYRRVHVAVGLGVAVAAAVLTGALLVGDSVRGSLRDLTMQRLGRIDSALVAGNLFRAVLADELAADADFPKHFTAAEPALLLSGTLQSGSGDAARRATRVSVVGCRPSFWDLGTGGPHALLGSGEIAITESLARELAVEVGDSILLRVPVAGSVPVDSPLGRKEPERTSRSRRLTVAAVLPPEGLARFGLVPSQHWPRNVFVPLEEVQSLIEQPEKANAILVATDRADRPSGEEAQRTLQQSLQPRLADYGLSVQQFTVPTAYVQIAAERLVLPDEVVRAAERAFGADRLQPVVTYLANTLVAGDGDAQRKIPYSTITGVDSTAALGPVLDEASEPIVLADDEIALNRWAADDLQVEVGDRITVNFYEPESTYGRLREHEPPPVFQLRAIVDLADADGQPTPAADPHLTPELPGVTDQASIDDWDMPFELVETIRTEDEDYWDEYRTTPKAFVSLAAAKRHWPSRWGTISLLRLPLDTPAPDGDAASAAVRVADQLAAELDPAALGMTFLPVKSQGLAAASGTTPFDALFLGFSFFLIAAAVMLIALLFQLGVEQRAGEIGMLSAVGVGRKRLAGLLAREGLVVAAIGAVVGVVAGVLYAWLMIAGLRTWWVAAIATPFLELHITPRSLALGWLIGVAVSWLTIAWSIRRLVRLPAGRLLAGQTAASATPLDGRRRKFRWSMLRLLLVALIAGLSIVGFSLQGEAQAGAFFGTGAAVLILLLGEIGHRLRAARRSAVGRRTFRLPTLSALNIARNPRRSTLTIGLVAAASFLIVAMSAFRLDTGEEGTGGFALLATSDQPIHYDLDTPEGRLELAFSDADSDRLAAWRIFSLRVEAGEDASCLNLYRPTQPRVLGLPDELIDRGGFAWSGAAKLSKADATDNPWTLLRADLGADDAGRPIVPVVIDANTATYSLHLSGVGARMSIRDAADRPITLEVVGLLKNSVLQGSLMVSEANFLWLYPDSGGYRFFLIEPREGEAPAEPARVEQAGSAGASPARDVAAIVERTLAADGFDAIDAREQLAEFLAVQNTYLSTFQSLGALGLLLGTVGLAVVQLRSVLERRGELAVMRAAGFRRRRLAWMVVAENAVLLLSGLAVGALAAAIATVPQWWDESIGVPWRTLAALLGTIAVVGLVAGWLATRSALRAPLVPALRGD